MADGNSMPIGRGGRGAQLRNALLQMQRRPGQQQQQQQPEAKVASKESGDVTVINKPKSVPLGRAAKLAQMRTVATLPKAESPEEPPAKPLGRGQMLSCLSKPSHEAQSSHASDPEPPSLSRLSIQDDREPVIKLGSAGKPVQLCTNYIRLKQTSPDKGLFEYHVSFEPVVDSKQMRFALLHQVTDIGKVRVFDGAKLYLPIRLRDQITTGTALRRTDNAEIKIKIKLIGPGNSAAKIHLYNVLFKKVMRQLDLARIGRNDYDPLASITIPQHRLEVWPGYVTAISDYEDGVMLNCDASFRVLRNVTAYNILREASMRRGQDYKLEAHRQLLGAIVLTRYNNKTYRIDDIAWTKTPLSTFERGGQEVSFYDYYKECYDITIEDNKQPILISHLKKQQQNQPSSGLVCLVPELCFLTGLTDELRSDFKVMKDIAVHTRISPNQRQSCLMKFRDNIMNNQNARNVLDEWGVALDKANVQLSGRVLEPEKIVFGNNRMVDAGSHADWGRALNDNSVISAVPLRKWIIIYTNRNQNQVNDFVKKFKVAASRFGMEIAEPQHAVLPNDSTEMYVRKMRDTITRDLQMFVIVFPTSRDDRYNAVKKLCCVDHPIPSQVIIAKTISAPPKLTSVSQKIALQVNCKLGGELWAVKIPMKNYMICGLDVYHDAKTGGKSVVGFTATMNQTSTRWFCKVHFQNPGEELANSLKLFLASACQKYHDVNHCLPQKIIIYRDGVGDGQLQYVADYEINQLVESLSCFKENYNPSITVVIVQKRINTRLFLSLRNGLENPSPGTILDHTVTRKHWYDFFLVSQHVRQGTVTPTHYIVVFDNSNLTPDHVQKLTYKMTHLYYNWPGTIRSPAPCQYAHKLAYQVGQNLHKMPSQELCDRLFFL